MATATDKRLRRMLEQDEGRKSRLFFDSKGIPTIAVGRNLRDAGLSPDEIDYLLTNDINERSAFLAAQFSWWSDLTDARQAALINMSFMGVNKLLDFTRMWAALRREDWQAAHDECLDSKWAKEDVQLTRSQRVANMLLTGQWPQELA